MPPARIEFIAALPRLDSAELMADLAAFAAAVLAVDYAGFVRADPLREAARPVYVLAPPGDPLRVRPWLAESGVLKELALSADPVRLPRDPSVGEPGFLAAPIPMATLDHGFLWAAGRGFRERDEHLLGRLAAAAGRALEAACELEAAARMLRGVQAFSGR
ncbi:hypothetical protein [Nonomuraea sediminis]|uniref:hypothetical protein n=1 Tax=Nonomuraea sediminis TaxID=2835864 RepID=UPI001BDC7FD9|nr:hypothetical protein [Nonomuraea sediminis]